jgi:hypothetical protein
MKNIRFYACLALAAALVAPAALAMTAVEHQVETAAAPHAGLGQSGEPVIAHYVRFKYELLDKSLAANSLDSLKRTVAACVHLHSLEGLPSRPPAEFPDQFFHAFNFEYSAPNRRIAYKISYGVAMADDCSLIETIDRTAELRSSKGTCKIDLVRKTAKGVCDPAGHADAPRNPLVDRAQMKKTLAALEADPRFAAGMARVRPFTHMPEGVKRTIAAYECEESDFAGLHGCTSRAGSFIPTVGYEGVALSTVLGPHNIMAQEAKFDMPVSSAVFAPYMAGGYTITGR